VSASLPGLASGGADSERARVRAREGVCQDSEVAGAWVQGYLALKKHPPRRTLQ
jgi:hypothetical protein